MSLESTDTPRRATRDTHDVWLGGVASGLAQHLGVPTVWVRAAFVALSVLGGVGVAFYAGLWMTLPTDARFARSAPGIDSATRTGKRPGERRRLAELGPVAAVAAVAVGVVLLAEATFGRGFLFWPVLFGIGGVAFLWRQADEAQRERWMDTSSRVNPLQALLGSGGPAAIARIVAGVGLIVIGLVIFAVNSGDVQVARDVLIASLLGVAGIALTLGPWVFRLASDLTQERAERVRSQERADMAAHLHDSVLQTLALIQKNAGDSAVVSKLARAQERDLRSWLFDEAPPAGGSLASALKELAAETDDVHGIAVDVITVGDTPLTETLQPLVLATREALTNAARHAGASRIDVYAEVTPQRAEVFVRDRGAGFDPASIAADRQGVRRSIIDRMTRHGGTAAVQSAPGEGTEVRLAMPLEENDD
ncbi:PspC domain-containing protein [Nocardioides sp.]|uniref:ATP-binding protein n=1 Tax=Nocardioides sp. TaxID=35761 RepID=UPI003D15184F